MTPAIDFYILEKANKAQALIFTCKLIEKAYEQQKKIHLHTSSRQEAENIDSLLWTYREDSFLPHAIMQENNELAAIQIGFDGQAPEQSDLMINLHTEVPNFYSTFNRVIEIVFNDVTVQQLARERFRHYRNAGCPIQTHKINNE